MSASTPPRDVIELLDSDEEPVAPVARKKQRLDSSSAVVVAPKKSSGNKGKKRMSREDSAARYRSLPDAIVQRKWDETIFPAMVRRVYENEECWEITLATQGSGYPQLMLNGSSYGEHQGFYLTHIWSMRYHGRYPADLSHLTDPDCSHLCHNKICSKPDHMIFEEGRNNKRRNLCPYKIDGTLMCQYIHEGPPCLHPHSSFEDEGRRRFDGYGQAAIVESRDEPPAAPAKKTKKARRIDKPSARKHKTHEKMRGVPADLLASTWQESILPHVVHKAYGDEVCWETHTLRLWSGYSTITLKAGQQSLRGQHLAHVWSAHHHGRVPVDLTHLMDPDISHLCHNKLCVKPDHFVIEEGRNNKKRNACPHKVNGLLICPYMHDGPACVHPHSLFEANGVRVFGGYQ